MSILDDTHEARKRRGAFFTPRALTDFVTTWAMDSSSRQILEPSSGDGAFLASIDRVAKRLGTKPSVTAHELHDGSAADCRELMQALGLEGEVVQGDFLRAQPEPRYQAVIGNPPYVRFQEFAGESRQAGLSAARAQGVELSQLSSSWAPFVVHAGAFLEASGRMGMVLPAELLAANYAQAVRDHLLKRFADIRIVMLEGQVFPGVQTEALLLLAEGAGGTGEVKFAFVRRPEDLECLDFSRRLRVAPGERWTRALVNDAATEWMTTALDSHTLSVLGDWGRISLGGVTGNNKYFTLSPAEVESLGLEASDVVKISPTGSSHLRRLAFTEADHEALGMQGARTLLFRPVDPSPAAQQYLETGIRLGVNQAYKCRTRRPWWRTPLPAAPDIFITYMNEQTPQLATNPAGLYHLNSVHGLYLDPDLVELADVLPIAALSTPSALSAEVVGRAYGGGVLKLEPSEALHLSVPSPNLVRGALHDLRAQRPALAERLAGGRLAEARELVDQILFGMLATSDDMEAMRRSLLLMRSRRRNRTAKGAA